MRVLNTLQQDRESDAEPYETGEKAIYSNGSNTLQTVTLTDVDDPDEIYGTLDRTGERVEVYDNKLFRVTNSGFYDVFSEHAVGKIYIESTKVSDLTHDSRIAVLSQKYLETATVVKTSAKDAQMLIDGRPIAVPFDKYDDIFVINDNPAFTIKARGLTRVSRLDLGNLDY